MASSAKTDPPFRAEHIGSLLRPERLLKAREELQNGAISAKQLKATEDECIREVVALQVGLGLNSISDGEFRQRSWFHDFVLGMRGTTIKLGDFAIDFSSDKGERRPTPTPYVEDKIKRKEAGITVERFEFLKSIANKTPKLTIPSPTVVHFFSGRKGVSRDVYPDIETFFEDLAAIYRQEIADLAAKGCTYLQLDEVPIALLCDPKIREVIRVNGDEPDELLRSYARLINRALDGRPPSLTVGMHLCRGNNRGHWLGKGGYEPVADVLFGEINVDAYFLEYDTDRAGDFKPLRHAAKDKVIVLGLVSTKAPSLESRDLLKKRIDEASSFVPLERLALSPQCGFASNFLGNPVTLSDQVRKLELIVSLAQDVWGHA